MTDCDHTLRAPVEAAAAAAAAQASTSAWIRRCRAEKIRSPASSHPSSGRSRKDLANRRDSAGLSACTQCPEPLMVLRTNRGKSSLIWSRCCDRMYLELPPATKNAFGIVRTTHNVSMGRRKLEISTQCRLERGGVKQSAELVLKASG